MGLFSFNHSSYVTDPPPINPEPELIPIEPEKKDTKQEIRDYLIRKQILEGNDIKAL